MVAIPRHMQRQSSSHPKLWRAMNHVPNAQSPCSQHCSWVGNAKNAAR
ncbi:Uncharacterised protein [Vibrio cholerae]|uniref:Uncharacterized protein n=1 Tax=Vibrio cholerae TaxID=666 RepID=A0A655ZXB5_VIBCL|nr:Uncharacterised protein [Vibrio cholerae]